MHCLELVIYDIPEFKNFLSRFHDFLLKEKHNFIRLNENKVNEICPSLITWR